jgi:hypothetical protein
LLYLALIAVLSLADHFVLWPAFLRRSLADAGRARRWLWSGWMIELWTLAAAGLALWLFEARAWALLRFTTPHGWRLWAAIGVVLAFAAVSARPAVRIARSKRPRRVKIANPNVERLVPHTGSELSHWVALSLSAGFCEELIFRGYLIWVFQPFLGLWGAAALSLVVFALSHAYQGVHGMLSVGIVGGLLTLVVLICGSLWPAMALHALIDIGHGLVVWLVFRQAAGEGATVPT